MVIECLAQLKSAFWHAVEEYWAIMHLLRLQSLTCMCLLYQEKARQCPYCDQPWRPSLGCSNKGKGFSLPSSAPIHQELKLLWLTSLQKMRLCLSLTFYPLFQCNSMQCVTSLIRSSQEWLCSSSATSAFILLTPDLTAAWYLSTLWCSTAPCLPRRLAWLHLAHTAVSSTTQARNTNNDV